MTDLIAAYAQHLRAAGRRRRTIGTYVELLHRVDRDLPLGIEQATVEELTAWLARDEWAAATRALYHAGIRGFFDWACANAHLDWNPAASLTRPRVPAGVPRPVTHEELAHALTYTSAPTWRLLVLLAAYAGLRDCELATVRREHVTDERLTIRGKGGKSRAVPTWPQVWALVHALPPGPLAGGLTARQIPKMARREMDRIGLPGVTMHRFRHWFGTYLLRPARLGGAGADLRTVQGLLGHASPAQTATYTEITDEQRQMAIAALPVLVNPASS